MIGATHFIEQYRDKRSGRLFQTPQPAPIRRLKKHLKTTELSSDIETTLVVYIKFKDKK